MYCSKCSLRNPIQSLIFWNAIFNNIQMLCLGVLWWLASVFKYMEFLVSETLVAWLFKTFSDPTGNTQWIPPLKLLKDASLTARSGVSKQNTSAYHHNQTNYPNYQNYRKSTSSCVFQYRFKSLFVPIFDGLNYTSFTAWSGSLQLANFFCTYNFIDRFY